MSLFSPRIYTHYKFIVCQDLIYSGNFKNIMELPCIVQCVLNCSLAAVIKEKTKILPPLIALEAISGQKSKTTRSRRSIAAFNLRKNDCIGCTVKLRGRGLYSFLDQYITLVLPRLREFYGIGEQNFPTPGHYNSGCDSFVSFPELETHFLTLESLQGFNCTLSTDTKNAGQTHLLLTALNIPLNLAAPLRNKGSVAESVIHHRSPTLLPA